MKVGTRNNIKAEVVSVKKGDIMSMAKFKVLSSGELSSVSTTESFEELGLKPGDQVELIIKAIHVIAVKP
jgi:molybdopterin-binding protein